MTYIFDTFCSFPDKSFTGSTCIMATVLSSATESAQTSTGYKEPKVLWQQYGRHRQSRIYLWSSRARELHRYETPGCAEGKQPGAWEEARGTKRWCSWVSRVRMYCPVTCMKMPPSEEKAANLKAHFPPFWHFILGEALVISGGVWVAAKLKVCGTDPEERDSEIICI